MRDSTIVGGPSLLCSVFLTTRHSLEVPFPCLIGIKIIEHNSAGKLRKRRHPLCFIGPSAITEAVSPGIQRETFSDQRHLLFTSLFIDAHETSRQFNLVFFAVELLFVRPQHFAGNEAVHS